ncbi:hypothetical protein GCM10022243_41190 [Saccharothrix violaceirubra]|uniref:Flagellar protein FliO/FliZ n=1 Tax=Saccharothrix violaceirubra TaxID=413306 RepID=A0A7W7WYF1_9PSEU|nr:flagellar biosynthetic protein FliO [Saccharothrix violaceirubra]MBB4968375.1 flagellar protein FliO/FliZ [Saccharothrix violaceirubra]
MEALPRLLLGLVLILGLLWLIARVLRRPMRGRAVAAGLEVLARTQLTRGAGVAVVRVDRRALVLGVTDAGVSLLHEADADVFTAPTGTTHRTPLDLDELQARTEVQEQPAADGTTSKLNGSALSPATWRQAFDALKERSVRS